MATALTFGDLGNDNSICKLDLHALYRPKELEAFDLRWTEFLASDEGNALVLNRTGNIVTYPHKSWLPKRENGKPSLMLLFGKSSTTFSSERHLFCLRRSWYGASFLESSARTGFY